MANYNPYGDFSYEVLPADTKPQDIFKDVPYTPDTRMPSETEKARMEKKAALLRLSVEKKDDDEEPKIILKTLVCESFQENPQCDFSEYHFKDLDGKSWHNQFPRVSGPRDNYEWPVFPRPGGDNHYVIYFDLQEHVERLTRRRSTSTVLSDLLNEENERFTRYRNELLSKVSVG